VTSPENVDHATEEYTVSMEVQQRVLDALDYAGEPGMALAQLSNKLAAISTKDIMAVVVPLQENKDYNDPQTKKIMQVYQVVLERGTPGWAVLFCTTEIAGFTMNSMIPEKYIEGINMRKGAKLSAHPSEMEKKTFASIQLDLETDLRSLPPEQLKQIELIEQMQRDKVVEFPIQPLENLVLEKASCYYWLGRDEEARA
jgi:hypothetical protein